MRKRPTGHTSPVRDMRLSVLLCLAGTILVASSGCGMVERVGEYVLFGDIREPVVEYFWPDDLPLDAICVADFAEKVVRHHGLAPEDYRRNVSWCLPEKGAARYRSQRGGRDFEVYVGKAGNDTVTVEVIYDI